jgi:hypothetical protein
MKSRLYSHALCRFREANPVFTKVEDRVVSTHEYITKNPAVVQSNFLDCAREQKHIFELLYSVTMHTKEDPSEVVCRMP